MSPSLNITAAGNGLAKDYVFETPKNVLSWNIINIQTPYIRAMSCPGVYSAIISTLNKRVNTKSALGRVLLHGRHFKTSYSRLIALQPPLLISHHVTPRSHVSECLEAQLGICLETWWSSPYLRTATPLIATGLSHMVVASGKITAKLPCRLNHTSAEWPKHMIFASLPSSANEELS